MSMYMRITVAGSLVIKAVYPAPYPRDSAAARAGKHALTSEAQQRMNLKYSYQKLELLLAANFGVKDLYATLTYDDDHLPTSRKEANARVNAFIKRLRAARKARDQELRYLYVTEHRHGEGRWHHHILINATGEDFELIRRLWGQGGVDFKQLRIDKEKNYETLAKYLCKEPRDKVGQRLWSPSRNLRKPETECFRVPDDTLLDAPRGSTIMASVDHSTTYGSFRYLKYLAAGWTKAPKPRAKRRRRRPLRL